jgi:hypothetical protein
MGCWECRDAPIESTHARYDVARICIPAGWLRWWRRFVDQWVPKRKPGRPVTQAVDSA